MQCGIAGSCLHCRLAADAASTAGLDGVSFFDKGEEPSEDALPTFGVTGRGGRLAGETFVPNSEQRAGASALRTIGMKSVNALWLEFPVHHGLYEFSMPTMNPCVNELAWRIDFQILALDAE